MRRLGLVEHRGCAPSICALAVLTLIASIPAGAATPKFAQRFQEWLTGPTSYLVTKAERAAFLALKTDEERDKFVDRFWALRNPALESESNGFKEEFFRRVAWANAHFGNDVGGDGWRSDRGRTYILFGKPQGTTTFPGEQQLYPVELWFYANPGLSELPSFFYVLFFDRDAVGGYHFYHPYVDGPDKLVRSGYSKSDAYRYLRTFSPELARASLSLIPGEPVDTDTFSGSMASMSIIHGIQGYSEMPSYVSMIQARAFRLERVTSQVHFDLPQASLLAFVSREKGEPWLHYQVAISDPLQPKAASGKVQYDITARIFANEQLVFERADSPGFSVEEAAAEDLKVRPFLFEDRLPVTPGKYRLTVAVRNKAANKTYEASRTVEVDAPAEEMTLSDILIVDHYQPDTRERPFQFGGYKFQPSPSAQARPPRDLSIFYEVNINGQPAEDIPVEYLIGNVASKFRTSFEEKLPLTKADMYGSLFTAKSLATGDLTAGSYQLVVRLKDPRTGRFTAKSLPFVVVTSEEKPPIVVSQARVDTPEWQAANYYERALCWLAQGREPEALKALETSWTLSGNKAIEPLLRHLQESAGGKARASSF
jgi:GWxTD domain-containing protein